MSTPRTLRWQKLLKIVISVAVVGGGVTYLLWSTAGSAFEYYKHVDEVASEKGAWQKKPLQLHGFVVPGSIERRLDRERQQLEYRFREANCGREVEVHYAGTVPDTFKDGAEVVCKGEFDGEVFLVEANGVMAKCPSKYQATAGPATLCARGKGN